MRSRLASLAAGFLACALAVAAAWPTPAAEMLDDRRRAMLLETMERHLSSTHGYLNTQKAIDQMSVETILGPYLHVPAGVEAYSAENARIVSGMIDRLRDGRSVSVRAWTKYLDTILAAECLSCLVQSYASHVSSIEQARRHGWEDPGPFRSFRLVRSDAGQLRQEFFDIADGVAYLEQLAKWRHPQIQLAHRLGEVTIRTAARDERRRELLEAITQEENQADSARNYLRALEREIDMESHKLRAEAEYEQDRLAPFEAALKAAAGEADGRRPDADATEPGPGGRAATIRRKRQERRVVAIDAALDNLRRQRQSQPWDGIDDRIAELERERATLAGEPATPVPVSTRSSSAAEQARLEDAAARYRSEAFISRKRLDSLAIPVEVKTEQKQRLLGEVAAHEAKIAALQKQLDELGAGGVPPFTLIESADAALRFDGGAQTEAAELARLIAEQAQRLRETERRHAEATKDIRLRADQVFDAAIGERNATGWSYVAQAVVQAAIQIADNAWEAKGNPHAFFAMSMSQMAANLTVAQPRFYDADIDRETGEAFVANMPGMKARAIDAVKASGVTAVRPLAEHGAMAVLDKALRAASGSPKLVSLAAVATARAELGKAIAATPKRSPAFSIAKAALLDAATEELKSEIAKAMQEKRLRAYITAQEALSDALRRRTELSELRDLDQSLLDSFVSARAHLRGGSVALGPVQTAGIRIERNEPFDAEGGYAITLDVAGADKSILSDVEMQLGGFVLKRGTAPGRYEIDEDTAALIRAADLPEELPVTLLIK